jgi:hypothetical protein
MVSSPFAQNFGTPVNAGANPPSGVVLNYFVRQAGDSAKASVTLMDKNRKVIRTFSTTAKEANAKMEVSPGMNRFVWNLLFPPSERIEGMVLWNGVPNGILAPPGSYYARVKVEQDSVEVPFEVKADPNYKMTAAAYEEQFAFLKSIQDKFNETQQAIKDIRALRAQINSFTGLQGAALPAEVKTLSDSILKAMAGIEETLYQTKAKSSQDVLNYPIRLNDKLSGLFDVANSGNFAPSRQSRDVYADLSAQIDAQLKKFRDLRATGIPALNEAIRQKALPVIGIRPS